MIRALWWKDAREHGPVWLVVAAVTILVTVALGAVLAPGGLGGQSALRTGLLGLVQALAAAYGVVCGAMMLAGEREAGTLPLLDVLTARRGRVWAAKLPLGLGLSVAHGLTLAGFVAVVGLAGGQTPAGLWFAVLPFLAVDGFCWGLAGSAFGRTVFGAALIAVVFLGASWVVTGLAALLSDDALIMPVRVAFMAVAVELSRRAFCAPDFRRREAPAAGGRRTAAEAVGTWRALVWLTVRQGRLEAAIVLGFAAAVGLFLPLADPLAWPLGVLLAAVACGAAVFGREQEDGSGRFLGDQRFPVRRVWAVKSLCWLAVAVVAAALVLLGTALSYGIRARYPGTSRPDLLDQLWGVELLRGTTMGFLLLVGISYGFAVGQLAGLVLRRRLIALVVGGVTSAAVVLLWLPSLLFGGLYLWQLLGSPLLLLGAVPAVLWWWVSGRLASVRPVTVLAGGVVLAALWMAGWLWYRVAEVPDVPPPFDVRAFEASLPTLENNEAGPLIREAARELEVHQKAVRERLAPKQAEGPGAEAPMGEAGAAGEGREPPSTHLERADRVLQTGWPKKDEDLGRWLDEMFAGAWAAKFRKAAAMPLGLVQDPRGVTFSSLCPHLQPTREAALLFTVRALQLQARGDDAAALDNLLVVLGLARQIRHKEPLLHMLVGRAMESTALTGLDRWLENVGPRKELLRRALEGVTRHAGEVPPATENLKAEFLMFRNTLDELFGREMGAQSRLYALARQVPWEKEREARLLNAVFASMLRRTEQALGKAPAAATRGSGEKPPGATFRAGLLLKDFGLEAADLPWVEPLSRTVWGPLLPALRHVIPGQAADRCVLGGTRLRLALALYRLDQGKPATRLQDLVPRYLDAVPIDPYDGQPFRYRVSTGERIQVMRPTDANEGHLVVPDVPEEGQRWTEREIPAGQGIVWSVGPDGRDDGARRQGLGELANGDFWIGQGLDAIFLVPRWPD